MMKKNICAMTLAAACITSSLAIASTVSASGHDNQVKVSGTFTEKLFRSDKTFIGSKSERVQSSQSMSSKIFMEFVALIVRNRIYNLLKDQVIRMESRQKYMAIPAAIRELEKIEMVRRNNGNYKLDHAVTKTQKIILSSFYLDETDISSNVDEIMTFLKP